MIDEDNDDDDEDDNDDDETIIMLYVLKFIYCNNVTEGLDRL